MSLTSHPSSNSIPVDELAVKCHLVSNLYCHPASNMYAFSAWQKWKLFVLLPHHPLPLDPTPPPTNHHHRPSLASLLSPTATLTPDHHCFFTGPPLPSSHCHPFRSSLLGSAKDASDFKHMNVLQLQRRRLSHRYQSHLHPHINLTPSQTIFIVNPKSHCRATVQHTQKEMHL